MRNYIILSEDDIKNLKKGNKVACRINDNTVFIMSEETFKIENSITNGQWKKAIQHLDNLIVMYATIGVPGNFGLYGILIPLKRRYETGERTKELYDAIMACE